MLRILALSAALATAPALDLPELFADELAEIEARSTVPVLLPQTMAIELDDPFTAASAARRRWRLELDGAPDCRGANVCFVARFSASTRGEPRGPKRIALARGRTGRFRPMSCGISCAPAEIAWRERGATFVIEAKVKRRELVRMANSAIRNGPR